MYKLIRSPLNKIHTHCERIGKWLILVSVCSLFSHTHYFLNSTIADHDQKKKTTTAEHEEMNRRLTNSPNRCKQIFRTIVCMIGCLCTVEAHISEPLSSPCSNGVSWAMAHRNDDDASAMMIKINRDASERKRKKQAKSRVSHNTFLCRFLLIYQCVMMLNDVWSVKCVENVAVCSINHWQLEARFFLAVVC